MNDKKKPFVVYSMKIARKLALQGYDILGTVPNFRNPKYYAYLFENTEEFQRALSDAIEEGRRNGK